MAEYIRAADAAEIVSAKTGIKLAGLVDIFAEIPTADVAPVVRCRDCQWFAANNYGTWYGCQMYNVLRDAPEDAPRPNDYCSFGERKEGNG